MTTRSSVCPICDNVVVEHLRYESWNPNLAIITRKDADGLKHDCVGEYRLHGEQSKYWRPA